MRLVLAVLLAVAVLAATSPAVDQARRDRAVGSVRGDLATVEAAAESLAATEERTGVDAVGPRRTVTVRVPPETATSARVDYVAIGSIPSRDVSEPPGGDVVAVAVAGSGVTVERIDVDLRVAGRDDAAIVLRRTGRHRLTLTPTADGGAVAVARVETPTAAVDAPAPDSSRMTTPTSAMTPLSWLRSTTADCDCRATVEDDRLHVDADDCPGGGDLAGSSACRRTAIGALSERAASTVVVSAAGLDRVYDRVGGELLAGVGRFVDRVAVYDETLAARAREAPLSAAETASARAGPVATVATETGLAALSERVDGLTEALRPRVGLSMAGSLVDPLVADASLRTTVTLPGGNRARVYDRPDEGIGTYHLSPAGPELSAGARRTLVAARERLGAGAVGGGPRAPHRAVRAVADDDDPIERLAGILSRHTRGFGVIGTLLADDAVSDVSVTAPVEDRSLGLVRDGRRYRTNVRLTPAGARTIASRVRRASGRAFSRASPTVDASVETVDGTRVRVAGLTAPISDGLAFAVRRSGEHDWTLPALVANGTLSPDAAALLSVATRRDAATLVAGPRGAGKTTALGALLWELRPTTRAVVVEDTPELPVERLGTAGRDVQRLLASPDGAGPDPSAAVRTALRLGEGALVVGEIRGREATALFEAMRVGKRGSAVLGTVHGEGGSDVRDRVVEDLGVSPGSFAATDLVVTMGVAPASDGAGRHVATVEEHTGGGAFDPLYDRSGGDLAPTGRIDRGTSRVVADLATPDESYADVRETLADRRALLDRLARAGRTAPESRTAAYAAARAEAETPW